MMLVHACMCEHAHVVLYWTQVTATLDSAPSYSVTMLTDQNGG